MRFSEAEIVKTFNDILDGIVAGGIDRCPAGIGIDIETMDILNSLALQPDPKRPSDIAACRTEFGRQLDGTHDREAENALDAELLA